MNPSLLGDSFFSYFFLLLIRDVIANQELYQLSLYLKIM